MYSGVTPARASSSTRARGNARGSGCGFGLAVGRGFAEGSAACLAAVSAVVVVVVVATDDDEAGAAVSRELPPKATPREAATSRAARPPEAPDRFPRRATSPATPPNKDP